MDKLLPHKSLDRSDDMSVDILKKHGKEAFAAYVDFERRLKKNNPNKFYTLGRGINPKKPLITYIASLHDETPAGMLIGVNEGKCFRSERLVVDPQFRRRGVAERLMNAVKLEFDEYRNLPTPFGLDITLPAKKFGEELIKLRDFYKKHGFVPDEQSRDPWAMVWRKSTGPKENSTL